MTNCYVLQVLTGKEERYLAHVKRTKDLHCKLILPRRELTIKRRGKFMKLVKPIFPGYIFWETDDPDLTTRELLRKQPFFMWYLKEKDGVLIPLKDEDRTIISSLTVDGEIARKSQVVFDRNKRVRVLKGPLKGNEGAITKVDKRKHRVTVEINLYDKRFKIDLEYEEVEKVK